VRKVGAAKPRDKHCDRFELVKTAPGAIAALIRGGPDARSLFLTLFGWVAEFDEPSPELVELETLLDAWESHLPARHWADNFPYWTDVAATCQSLAIDLRDGHVIWDGGFVDASILLDAIAIAALAHRREAQPRQAVGAATEPVLPPKNVSAKKIGRRHAEPFDNGRAGKATRRGTTPSPNGRSNLVEPEEAAPEGVASLIRGGPDARSLFLALYGLAAEFDEPSPELVELETLLDAWESHLPAGHRAGDARFWDDVAAVCQGLNIDLSDGHVIWEAMGRVEAGILLNAIETAALAHRREVEPSTGG